MMISCVYLVRNIAFAVEWCSQETLKHFLNECPVVVHEEEMEWASEGYIREIGLERFNDWITGGDLGLRHGHPEGGGWGSLDPPWLG